MNDVMLCTIHGLVVMPMPPCPKASSQVVVVATCDTKEVQVYCIQDGFVTRVYDPKIQFR